LGFKVSSADTDGAWALIEYVAPPKFAEPPLHWHKVTSECFYVLEGSVAFRMGKQVFGGEPGAMVYIPTHTLHTFSNQSDKPARFLTLISPGGFEEYFKELVALSQAEPSWPPEDMGKITALYRKYDTFLPDEL
jgi:quercetin dioxygenase-like cupin family protein